MLLRLFSCYKLAPPQSLVATTAQPTLRHTPNPMLQELLQKFERELEYLGSGGGTSVCVDLDPEKVRTLVLGRTLCITCTTKQCLHLHESVMRVSNTMLKLANTLAPINKLPPEILGMIPKYEGVQTPRCLIAVSGVRSYWRKTFITTPSLWTSLDGKGVEKS